MHILIFTLFYYSMSSEFLLKFITIDPVFLQNEWILFPYQTFQ